MRVIQLHHVMFILWTKTVSKYVCQCPFFPMSNIRWWRDRQTLTVTTSTCNTVHKKRGDKYYRLLLHCSSCTTMSGLHQQHTMSTVRTLCNLYQLFYRKQTKVNSDNSRVWEKEIRMYLGQLFDPVRLRKKRMHCFVRREAYDKETK